MKKCWMIAAIAVVFVSTCVQVFAGATNGGSAAQENSWWFRRVRLFLPITIRLDTNWPEYTEFVKGPGCEMRVTERYEGSTQVYSSTVEYYPSGLPVRKAVDFSGDGVIDLRFAWRYLGSMLTDSVVIQDGETRTREYYFDHQDRLLGWERLVNSVPSGKMQLHYDSTGRVVIFNDSFSDELGRFEYTSDNNVSAEFVDIGRDGSVESERYFDWLDGRIVAFQEWYDGRISSRNILRYDSDGLLYEITNITSDRSERFKYDDQLRLVLISMYDVDRLDYRIQYTYSREGMLTQIVSSAPDGNKHATLSYSCATPPRNVVDCLLPMRCGVVESRPARLQIVR